MQVKTLYHSPIGTLALISDSGALASVIFQKEAAFAAAVSEIADGQNKALCDAELWLNSYFKGDIPKGLPELGLSGTKYQLAVWEELLKIPYGKTASYKEIAIRAAENTGSPGFSAQAAGGAAGRNPVPIIVPCHRVIGSDGSLTGYRWGVSIKKALLSLENAL